jgi:hypothetical protein
VHDVTLFVAVHSFALLTLLTLTCSVHMLYLENYIARKLSYEKYVSEHVARKKTEKRIFYKLCFM